MANRTVTIKASTGDYNSVNQFQANESTKDLVTNTRILTIEGYTLTDTTNTTLSGWTDSASYYLNFVGINRCSRAGVGGIVMDSSGSYDYSVTDQTGYSRWSNWGFNSASNGRALLFNTASARGNQIKNCVFRGTYAAGVRVSSGSSGSIGFKNSFFMNWSEQGLYFDSGFTATSYVNNCTIVHCCTGSGTFMGMIQRDAGTVICKNNIFDYNGTRPSNTFDASGTFSASSTNNLRRDGGSAVGSNGKSGAVTYIDSANNDWGLASSDTGATDQGADLTADTYAVTDDFDGTARPQGGATDIGAYETAAQATFPPVPQQLSSLPTLVTM